MSPRPRRITIAVLTFHRPEHIGSVLPLLDVQRTDPALADCAIEILVVDNDPAGSARAAVQALAIPGLRYVIEAGRGIATARNRALDESAASQCLAFIDDDERPEPGWLAALLQTQEKYAATAVAGAVRSQFDGTAHPWVAAGEFLSRRHRADTRTGEAIDTAATNNLLLDLAGVRGLGVRFDPDFGLTGGEDTLFTRTLVQRGGRLVWCREAVVVDQISANRISTGWMLRRAFSYGNTDTRVAVALTQSRRGAAVARVAAGLHGPPRMVAGLARWLLGWVTGSVSRQARGLLTMCRGAGMSMAAVGYAYRAYGRRPGAAR